MVHDPKPWRRCRDGKPHLYRRARRWLASWRKNTESWMLIAAHDWCAQRNVLCPDAAIDTEDVLAYLKTGRALTPRVALDRWGIMRLAARVKELRYQGLKIDTHLVSFGRKRYAQYAIEREGEQR